MAEDSILSTVLDNMPLMIYLKDHRGVILYHNQKLANFLECDELTNRHSSFIDNLLKNSSKVLNSEKYVIENSRDCVIVEEEIELPNGYISWICSTKISIKKDDTIYTLVTIEDIKKRKNFQESSKKRQIDMTKLNSILKDRVSKELEKNRAKDHLMIQQSKLAAMGEMIGNIAHQWRQPLNALSLTLAKIDVYFKKGVLTQEELDSITSKSQIIIEQMSNTIDDFRNFYKPNREKEIFSLQDAINSAIKIVEASLQNQNIELEYKSLHNTLIYGYKSEFSQVLLNIISNSKDALKNTKGSLKTISIKDDLESSNFATIEIEDSGGGVDLEIIDKIFDPYFSTKYELNGTGIGLYMSKKIIEDSMGGKIFVKNGEKGAIFTIHVPIAQGE